MSLIKVKKYVVNLTLSIQNHHLIAVEIAYIGGYIHRSQQMLHLAPPVTAGTALMHLYLNQTR